MNFAIFGMVVSVLFEHVPKLKALIEPLTPNQKRWFFAAIIGGVAIIMNMLALHGLGGGEPLAWVFLRDSFVDWVVAYLGSSAWHGVVNKSLEDKG